MNSRAFVLSLVVAGIAAFIAYSFIKGKETEYINKYGTPQNTVVAKVDIKQFELIDDNYIETKAFPRKFIAPGAFTKPEDVVNNIALTPIKKGEQITRPRITIPGLQTGLSRQVAQGKRAVAIKADDIHSASLLIKPGDRVDVLALIDCCQGKMELKKVQTVLQDVLVLSTGLNVTNTLPLVNKRQNDDLKRLNLSTYSDFSTITLELDPFEAQKIIFLQVGLGASLYLTLRNNDDKKSVRTGPMNMYDVLGGESAKEAKAFFNKQKQ
jgi:pilus assembly protein CpaB